MSHAKEQVTISIVGPVAVGKSVIADRIAQVLHEEFGAEVDMRDANLTESLQRDLTQLPDWERELVTRNHWVIREIVRA